MTYAGYAAEISRVDRQIYAIHRELCNLEAVKRLSAASWQAAWDRHPTLGEQVRELFRERGRLQLERNRAAQERLARQPRAKRPKKCPTCGHRTLAA